MNTAKILYAKQLQQLYYIRFQEKLEIDWPTMNGVERRRYRQVPMQRPFDRETAEEAFLSICQEEGTTPDAVTTGRICRTRNFREWNVLNRYAAWVRDNNYSRGQAAELIKKDRTTLLHYIKNI